MKKLLLTILFVSLMVTSAFAGNVGGISNVNDAMLASDYSDGDTAKQMDTITFGNYNGKNIEWIVLDNEGDRALLMSKDVICSVPYVNCTGYTATSVWKKTNWANSNVRNFLNNQFYNQAFDSAQRGFIVATEIDNTGSSEYNTKSEANTVDNVFILSTDEITSYLSSNSNRTAYKGADPEFYMLRDIPDIEISDDDDNKFAGAYEVRGVTKKSQNAGKIDANNLAIWDGEAVGVRPCIWVSISDVEEDNEIVDNGIVYEETIIETTQARKKEVKNGWQGDYYYENDNLVVNAWRQYGADWYYLGADGKVLKNQWIDGTFYVDANGKMLTNTTTPDGKKVGADGKVVVEETTKSKKVVEETTKSSETVKKTEGKYKIPVEVDAKDFNGSTVWKQIEEDRKKEAELVNSVYYYAKQGGKNDKIYTSIEKKTIRDGLFGTGIFARTNMTYYNVEIKLNEETTKRLSKYAEFSAVDKTFINAIQWVLLAGDSVDNLENVGLFGISPACDNDWLAMTEGRTYYQKGKIQISTNKKTEQEEIYKKIKNANVIMITTNNVIKSLERKYYNETYLGGFIRFESQKPIDGLNWVKGYVNCEEDILEYTKDHIGYSIYARDGNFNSVIYDKEIEKPWTDCESFEIFIAGTDSLKYAMYGNRVNYLANHTSAAFKDFDICGGKIVWECELKPIKNFKDFEIFYEARQY